jgi:hypothetical protein
LGCGSRKRNDAAPAPLHYYYPSVLPTSHQAAASESRPASRGSQLLKPPQEAEEIEDKEQTEAEGIDNKEQTEAEETEDKEQTEAGGSQEAEDETYCPVQIVIGDNKEEVYYSFKIFF